MGDGNGFHGLSAAGPCAAAGFAQAVDPAEYPYYGLLNSTGDEPATGS